MQSFLYIFLLIQTGYLFSFSILEKGVGPTSYTPFLAGNDNTWFVCWNQEGNIAGPIGYSFFDPSTNKMAPSKLLSQMQGIKPLPKINQIDHGIIVVEKADGGLQNLSFKGIPPLFSLQKPIDGAGVFPRAVDAYYLDNNSGFCVFTDASSKLYYSFYNAEEDAFTKAQMVPQVQVGNSLLCASCQGTPLLVFSDLGKNQLFYALFNPELKRFDVFQAVEGSEDSCNAQLSCNFEGQGILTWNTGASTSLAGKIGYSVFDPQAQKFSLASFIAEESIGFQPAVKINRQGLALLCWTRLTSTGKEPLAYAVWDETSHMFEKMQLISGATSYANSCNLSLNDHNQAILCWFATLSGRIEYATFDPLNKTFNAALFIKETGINSQFPKVHLNSANKACMVWSVFGSLEYALWDPAYQTFSSALHILPSSKFEQGDFSKPHPPKSQQP